MVEKQKDNTAHPRGWSPELMKQMDIKVWSYLEEYEKEKEEILEAIKDVLESGQLILGKHVTKFEHDFSKYCDCLFGIGVNSCTDALALSLQALDVRSGDEVITVANTAVPTVAAISSIGAIPKFVEIHHDSYLMDVSKVEKAISKKTKAIIPVHLFGQCVDMDPLLDIAKKNNLKIVEDCAQAHGAMYKGRKAGSMGDFGAFSFYPTKVLGTYGDGGMIVTNNEALAKRVMGLRMYGMQGSYSSLEPGRNSRLDEIHAAILLKKFNHLGDYISKRKKLAERYDLLLKGTSLKLPKVVEGNRHIYYVYVVRHPKRDEIMAKLKERGIFVNVSYEWPIHTMKGYSYLGYKEGDLPESEAACREIFSLPMYPELTFEQQDKVIKILKEILEDIG